MPDTQQIVNCLEKMMGMLGEIIKRLDALENRMDALENRMDALENRMDALENRMDALENRMDALESRVDEMDERLSKRIDELELRIQETEQRLIARFDEKLEILEFALDTEIQKVYEIAMENRTNMQLWMLRQTEYYNAIRERHKIAELDERLSVTEDLLQAHNLEIKRLQSIIA